MVMEAGFMDRELVLWVTGRMTDRHPHSATRLVRAASTSREPQPPQMEGRNDPPEYRVSSIARQYIHASFLRRVPQHVGCGDGWRYAGAGTISVTQSDAPDVTYAPAFLTRVRRLRSFFIERACVSGGLYASRREFDHLRNTSRTMIETALVDISSN